MFAMEWLDARFEFNSRLNRDQTTANQLVVTNSEDDDEGGGWARLMRQHCVGVTRMLAYIK